MRGIRDKETGRLIGWADEGYDEECYPVPDEEAGQEAFVLDGATREEVDAACLASAGNHPIGFGPAYLHDSLKKANASDLTPNDGVGVGPHGHAVEAATPHPITLTYYLKEVRAEHGVPENSPITMQEFEQAELRYGMHMAWPFAQALGTVS